MKYYMVRYKNVQSGDTHLIVHYSEKDALDDAVTMMKSDNKRLLDIYVLTYNSYDMYAREMQVNIESGRFKLEIVKVVKPE